MLLGDIDRLDDFTTAVLILHVNFYPELTRIEVGNSEQVIVKMLSLKGPAYRELIQRTLDHQLTKDDFKTLNSISASLSAEISKRMDELETENR